MSGARPLVFAAALAVGLVAVVRVFQREEIDVPAVGRVEMRVEALEGPVGMTLSVFPVNPGDSVRFLVDGLFFEQPDTTANASSPFLTGARSAVLSETFRGGGRWVEMAEGWVPAAVVDYFPVAVGDTLPAGAEGLTLGRALPWEYEASDLVDIPVDLVNAGLGSRGIRLRRGALEAFQRLILAADSAGLHIRIISGFRSAAHQRGLYSRQLVSKGFFQTVSAPPGRSEHQLGTTADVTAGSATPLRIGFGDTPEGRWVAANSEDFGLVLSFSLARHQARRVSYEPWHLRWVGENLNSEEDW